MCTSKHVHVFHDPDPSRVSGKTYASRSTFQKHFRSRRHKDHHSDDNKTDLYRRCQEMETELRRSREECRVWKKKYLELSLQTENVESLS